MKRATIIILLISFFFLTIFLIVLGFNIFRLLSRPPTEKLFNCIDNCTGPRSQYIITVYKGIDNIEDCNALKGQFIQPNIFTDKYYCKVNE